MVDGLESRESLLAWRSLWRRLHRPVAEHCLHRFIHTELALLAGELSSLLCGDFSDRIIVLRGRHQSIARFAASPRAGLSGLHRTGRTVPFATPAVGVSTDRADCVPVLTIAIFRMAVVDTLITFGRR